MERNGALSGFGAVDHDDDAAGEAFHDELFFAGQFNIVQIQCVDASVCIEVNEGREFPGVFGFKLAVDVRVNRICGNINEY